MPVLSVWSIRASMVHLALGFTFGALILINKAIPLHPAIWGLLPAHIELLLLGWVAQLAIGVAFWILPRFAGGRGDVRLAWASIFLLNLGVLSAALAPALGGPAAGTLVGRGLTVAAVAAFAAHAWPRIKPPGA